MSIETTRSTSVNENARIRIPLLDGEFGTLARIRAHAQILFLDIITRVTPAPLHSLRDEILPKYREAFDSEKRRSRSGIEIGKLATDAMVDLLYIQELAVKEFPRELVDLMNEHPLIYDAGAALLNWSDRFSLRGTSYLRGRADDADGPESSLKQRCWPVIKALQTIMFWHFHTKGSRWSRPDPPRWCPPVLTLEEPPALTPECLPPIRLHVIGQDPGSKDSRVIAPGWYVEWETEQQFRRRMEESFSRWLDGHVADRRQSAYAAGLDEIPGKQKLLLHFTWAAKFQIEKVSPPKLAREWRVTKDTVDAGIDGALDLIGIERRPPQRGGVKKAR